MPHAIETTIELIDCKLTQRGSLEDGPPLSFVLKDFSLIGENYFHPSANCECDTVGDVLLDDVNLDGVTALLDVAPFVNLILDEFTKQLVKKVILFHRT